MRFTRASTPRWSALALMLGLGWARNAQAGLLFHDEFENGTAAWTLSNSWGTTTSGPHTPTHSLADTPFSNYVANANGTATITTSFNLTSAQSPRFWFWLRYASEQFHDYLNVQTSINGVNWTSQNQFSGSQVDWKRFEVNLVGYKGQPTVYVRFQVQADGIIHNDGWYVDDFVFDDGNPAVTIAAPLGGSVLAAGSDLPITFSYDGTYAPLAQSISVFYSDVNMYYTIASGLPMDTTSVPWTVPNINIAQGYVRVELRDEYDQVLSQTTTKSFAIDSTTPGTFSLVSPADGACGGSMPSFDWGDASDANGVKYTLNVSPTSGAPLSKSNLSASQYQLEPSEVLASSGNPHSWSVTATDPAGHSRTTTARTYQVDAAPPAAFALTAPSDGTVSDGTGLVFQWDTTTDVGCGSLSHYTVYVDGDVCTGLLPPETDSIALDQTDCASLAPGAHTWTVMAFDTIGNYSYSGGWSFTILDDMVDPGAGGAGGEGGVGGAGGEAGTPGSGGTPASGGTAGSGGIAGSANGGVSSSDGGMPSEPDGGQSPVGAGGEPSPGTAGTASGTGGSAGSSNSSNKGGSKSTTPPGTGGDGEDPEASPGAGSGDDGGCGCRVATSTAGDTSSLITLLAALVLGLRRNRRRHPA